MYNEFPLDIDPKQDSPKRLSLLSGVPESYFTSAIDFNKIINGLSELYDIQKESKALQSGILNFDNAATGHVYGTTANPITTNLLIDPANQKEGGFLEVIFSGSVNPNIIGVAAADILNLGETITTQGLYSIFITFTGGKYKVNIQSPVAYVGDGDGLEDPGTPPTGASATTPVITVTDGAVPTATAPTITVTDAVVPTATAPVITVT